MKQCILRRGTLFNISHGVYPSLYYDEFLLREDLVLINSIVNFLRHDCFLTATTKNKQTYDRKFLSMKFYFK